ncbi:unnamed protein product [Penicillium camemberti]|uniref:Str. FM013 n=1 Tax=Penicillium camemberti (strain FM 013) TaxID=1429867 RepID=A0A0G4PK27_PENC3|nr:unnamed protein product [Penicillium camemberti]
MGSHPIVFSSYQLQQVAARGHPTHAATYKACRLAALIFGIGVLFSVPAQNTPLNTLARLIQSVLLQPSSIGLWTSSSTRLPHEQV